MKGESPTGGGRGGGGQLTLTNKLIPIPATTLSAKHEAQVVNGERCHSVNRRCPTSNGYNHPSSVMLTTAISLLTHSRAPHHTLHKPVPTRSCPIFLLLTATAPLEHSLTDLLIGQDP